MAKFVDLTGQKFGRSTVLEMVRRPKKDGYKAIFWKCQCSCPNKTITYVATSSLTHGATKSCGCLARETAIKQETTHGMSDSHLYYTWCNMRNRCKHPSTDSYELYGGRGIRVCDEWEHSFEVFRDWAFANGYKEGLSIDRINVDGNYEPSNCKWPTLIEQANNKRSNHRLIYHGESKTIAEWARECDIPYGVLSQRIYRHWSVERALETPVGADKWH